MKIHSKKSMEKEKQELQRIRNMNEEERLKYLEANPKVITNQSEKGKYKFMQKYYHRGAFFLDKEEEVLTRNVAEPTLEDHFDKTILPKVMQVKNFGLAGRTKYTHLLDQDTTRADDNPWTNQEKFMSGKGGGTKQVFDRPNKKSK
jgi:microfibrillar-associated protein 1